MIKVITLITALFVSGPLLAVAQETNAVERIDLQSFRIISQRNIFNPNRSSRSDRSERRRDPDRRVRSESFALVGTMNYDKGWFAFFDGSNSEYRRAVQPDDTIAGYKIAEIAANHVKLESTNSQPVELRVGMQMSKREESEWQVSDHIETPPPESTSASAETNSNSSSSAGESDIIKKLMEQREKELQK